MYVSVSPMYVCMYVLAPIGTVQYALHKVVSVSVDCMLDSHNCHPVVVHVFSCLPTTRPCPPTATSCSMLLTAAGTGPGLHGTTTCCAAAEDPRDCAALVVTDGQGLGSTVRHGVEQLLTTAQSGLLTAPSEG